MCHWPFLCCHVLIFVANLIVFALLNYVNVLVEMVEGEEKEQLQVSTWDEWQKVWDQAAIHQQQHKTPPPPPMLLCILQWDYCYPELIIKAEGRKDANLLVLTVIQVSLKTSLLTLHMLVRTRLLPSSPCIKHLLSQSNYIIWDGWLYFSFLLH